MSMMTWLEARRARIGGLNARIELQDGDVELLRLIFAPGPQPQYSATVQDGAAAAAEEEEEPRSSGTDVLATEPM
ncbi:hypothetical protein VD0002_g3162 [Verticillium dahliae]|uniref:Uncharacterized protein n=1 Tax=Verticillium dahliae TaxID=27337 RepID=A0AA44WF23_VERDA|nr:hypothetical protein VdG2_04801 [Verticillium dahliae VDG2]PNH29865.1 hypothetical protein BJF96_g6683 [Verticillium dahliae]PNH52475.1 hypothetical protein VD0003_g4839 [Verticillium dahliae]PNH66060.1 hypothetical protein VD0002_g3162 [Verticillium dahliae]